MTTLEQQTQCSENREKVPERPVTGVPEERGGHNGEHVTDRGHEHRGRDYTRRENTHRRTEGMTKNGTLGGATWTHQGTLDRRQRGGSRGADGWRPVRAEVTGKKGPATPKGSLGAGPAPGGPPCYVLSGETGKGVRKAEYVGGGKPGKDVTLE